MSFIDTYAAVLPFLTTVWGLVMALAPLLQIRVIVRNRDASGTSLTWVCILLIGFALWLSYGLTTGSPPLIIANSVSALVGIALLITIVVYRRTSPDGSRSSTEVPQP